MNSNNQHIIETLVDKNHRKSTLNLMIRFGLFITAYLFYFNFSRYGFTFDVQVQLGFVIFLSAMLLIVPKISDNSRLLTWILRIFMCITALFLSRLAGYHTLNSIQMWILIIPLLSYILLGERWGFAITLSSVFVSLMFFHTHYHDQLDLLPSNTLPNVISTFLVIWLIAHLYEHNTYKSHLMIAKTAITDPMTDLLNRSTLIKVFDKHQKDGLSLLMLDIDFFKTVNDAYGHEVGDIVIIEFAKQMSLFFADKGYVFRIGGEEFCVLLPKHQLKQTVRLANDFKKLIAEHKIDINTEDNQTDKRAINITISGGISIINDTDRTLNQLLKTADKNLYIAKHNGRNQIVS